MTSLSVSFKIFGLSDPGNPGCNNLIEKSLDRIILEKLLRSLFECMYMYI
jgi:hypothetical protein